MTSLQDQCALRYYWNQYKAIKVCEIEGGDLDHVIITRWEIASEKCWRVDNVVHLKPRTLCMSSNKCATRRLPPRHSLCHSVGGSVNSRLRCFDTFPRAQHEIVTPLKASACTYQIVPKRICSLFLKQFVDFEVPLNVTVLLDPKRW